jgi:hypothetical protein
VAFVYTHTLKDGMSAFTPAIALWNQREAVARLRDRFRNFSAAIGEPGVFNFYQWAQLASAALEFRPDCILELGRDLGNSTCCFLEVAHQLSDCRVVSLCRQGEWATLTVPRISHLVEPEWFGPADIRVCNIQDSDPRALLRMSQRCMVFWDAHGFGVAEWVLARLLPELRDKGHLILMHDLSDTRFEVADRHYPQTGIWKGTNACEPAFWLGNVFSRVAQAISVVDFCSRNALALHSAAESLHNEILCHPEKVDELSRLLGAEFFSSQAHWFWFTLNETAGELIFPPFIGTVEPEEEAAAFAAENRELKASHLAMQKSAGWRALNKWRGVRDSLAPQGSIQRGLYDSISSYLFRSSSATKTK